MEIYNELDFAKALGEELTPRSGLLPARPDFAVLRSEAEEVVEILTASFTSREAASVGDVVFADKVAKGARPLTVLTLRDAVLYRALVSRLAKRLPNDPGNRTNFAEFEQNPIDDPDATYVVTADVSAYYVYVDHQVLLSELIAQTGDAAAVDALKKLLQDVMGRQVGIPQVSTASDVLGDTHLDVVRRKLVRRKLAAARYADDFRITAPTLGEARQALEAIAAELYALGLVLNADKSLIYTQDKYAASTTRFREAERTLFDSTIDGPPEVEDVIAAFLAADSYGADNRTVEVEVDSATDDEDVSEDSQEESLLKHQSDSRDETEASEHLDTVTDAEPSDAATRAAIRAWELWESAHDGGTRDATTTRKFDAAVTRKLAARALRVLGPAGEGLPLLSLDLLMRTEPGLAPDVVAYLLSIPKGPTRRSARKALDELVEGQPQLSTWQQIWIAYAAGRLGRPPLKKPRMTFHRRPYVVWLRQRLDSSNPALVATAAASLGMLNMVDVQDLVSAVGRVNLQWRSLALWGLAHVDKEKALDCAEGRLERLIVEKAPVETS